MRAPTGFSARWVPPNSHHMGGSTPITLTVGLLSGKTATVTASSDEEVGALKRRAQTALGVGNGRLLGSFGNVLDAGVRIGDAGLQEGNFYLNRCQVQAYNIGFAAILGDGCVETWTHFLGILVPTLVTSRNS